MEKVIKAEKVRQTPHKQRGGTLLGVIIGALVGLGAALAVAVYVTKVPVPFLNKSQPRGAESDAQEAQKNKNWDPNAPLAGKNPARAVTPASSPSPEVTDSAITAPTAVPAAAASAARPAAVAALPAPVPAPAPATPDAPAKPVVPNDPLGDLAKARSQAKADAQPAASASGVDPFSYFIQVGAFRTPEDAEQQRAKLSLMGHQAKITEREQYGRTVYRVRLGPFDKKDEADKTKEKLDGNAIETALVRVQR